RGGVPALLATAAAPPARRARAIADGAWGAQEHVLERIWRHPESLRAPVRRLTAALPVMAAGRRRDADVAGAVDSATGAPPAPGSGAEAPDTSHGLRTAVLGSPAQEVAYVARQLRIARLRGQVPWSQMAVIARSSSQLGAIRRGLR